MSETTALVLLTLLGGYFALGLLFAIPFLWLGLARVDAAATGSSVGFRLTILPGVMLFWPLLIARWQRGARAPPEECNAHIRASRAERP